MEILDFLTIFDTHPQLCILLYQKDMLYMNKTFKEKLGFSDSEIKHLNPEDIFYQNKEDIKKIIQKRLNGEFFPQSYKCVEVYNKKSIRLYMNFFSQTIKLKENSYAGLVIGTDVTSEIRKDSTIKIIKDINQTIITNNNEKDIFNNIVNNIHSHCKYKFVCLAVKDKNADRMNLDYCKGDYEENLIHFLQQVFSTNPDNIDKCMATKYMLDNEFMVVNDLKSINFQNKELIDILIQNGFNSILFFPLFKNNKIFASIGICSQYVNDFDNETISLFKELKKDVEFAFEKNEKYSYLELLKNAIDKTFAWVVITDENAKVLYANKSVEEISGWTFEELKGNNPNIFKSGYHNQEFYKKLWKTITNNEVFDAIVVNKDKHGNLFYLKDRIIPVTTQNGEKRYISLAINITKEEKLKQKIKKLSYRDTVTGLYNRNGFIAQIEKLTKNKNNFAIIVADIKDFKIFNQLNGYEAGDFLLKRFADFLKTMFYDEDIIARIGGDEFGIFVKYNSLDELDFIIQKLLHKIKHKQCFKEDFSLNVGIALYPKDSENVSDLLEKALVALTFSQQEGEYTYKFFNKEIQAQIESYNKIKSSLSTAIKNKEFIYYYQPYVDTFTFKIKGAETLIRILRDNKLIYPDEFIDYAENSGYIKEIEKLMFDTYLKTIKKTGMPISFNISGNSLKDETHIKHLLKKAKNTEHIVIELTEREIATNISYTTKIIELLKKYNIKISIDDFGTGYSSLTYLKDLPADYIKIDISFIRNIETNYKDLAIVETIINFAHKFNLKTIAEGVENENQVKILQNLGCDYLQGYYFAKPMPFEKLLDFIKNNK